MLGLKLIHVSKGGPGYLNVNALGGECLGELCGWEWSFNHSNLKFQLKLQTLHWHKHDNIRLQKMRRTCEQTNNMKIEPSSNISTPTSGFLSCLQKRHACARAWLITKCLRRKTCWHVNTLAQRQNGNHFAGDIFNFTLCMKVFFIKISKI